MKQVLKGASEYDCASKVARSVTNAPKHGWKIIKRKMNKRHRKEGKQQCSM